MACNCPHCKKDDRVEKVTAIAAQRSVGVSSGWHSSIYSNGKSFGVASGPSIAVFNTSSDLVNMCQEPEEPKLGCSGTLLGIIFEVGELPVIVQLLCFVMSIGFFINLFFSHPPSLTFAYITSAVMILVFVYCAYLFFSKTLPAKNEQVKYASLLWARLYYCYRDGIFFDTDGQVYSTTTIRQILGN